MIEIRSGTISLDGVDISRVGVDALRRQLAIIPQDPVLFSGSFRFVIDTWDPCFEETDRCQRASVWDQSDAWSRPSCRSNLDPWNLHPDARLWEALEAVQLRNAVQALGGLFAKMDQGGDNLSVGQRQLFCLARALLQVNPSLCGQRLW